MKHENDVNHMIGCPKVVRIYWQFHERNKIYIQASYIAFLFVRLPNTNFIKKIKNCRTGENPRVRLRLLGFLLIRSRILQNVRLSFYQINIVFQQANIGFHQAMKARKICFIF